MQTYITRQEIADKLGLTIPMVSQAIANKVIPVDHNKGMVPRTWFNASKLTAAKIYEQTLEKQTKNTTTWGIIFITASLIIGTLIAAQ